MPLGSTTGESVITGHTATGATTSVYTIDAGQPLASVAVMVTGDDPAVVGVPDSTPADVNVNPVGSVPAVTAYV